MFWENDKLMYWWCGSTMSCYLLDVTSWKGFYQTNTLMDDKVMELDEVQSWDPPRISPEHATCMHKVCIITPQWPHGLPSLVPIWVCRVETWVLTLVAQCLSAGPITFGICLALRSHHLQGVFAFEGFFYLNDLFPTTPSFSVNKTEHD